MIMLPSVKSLKDVFIHIGIMVLLFLIAVVLFFYIYLPSTTRHGETIEVPKLTGLSLTQIQQTIDAKNLRFQINDSTYSASIKPYTVIEQTPSAGSLVKQNRKIYLTISTNVPPKVKMPKLVDGSLKSAEITLKGYGLELGEVKNISSPYLNLVLEQNFHGKSIEPGAYVAKGSKIDLSVGDGVGGEEVAVPALVGMNLDEAKSLLLEKGFNIGLEHIDSESTETTGKITKQSPEKGTALKVGGMVDIWVAE